MKAEIMSPTRHTRSALQSLSVLALSVLLSPTWAAISFDAQDPANPNGTNSDFFLVIWDETLEVSYIKDLGIRMPKLLGDGQANVGYQEFWVLDPNVDTNFKKLRDLGSAVSSLKWGVYALDTEGDLFTLGTLNLYTTLNHTAPTGTLNPNYTKMLGWKDIDFGAYMDAMRLYLGDVNRGQSNPFNTHQPAVTEADFAATGTTYAVKGQAEYWGLADGASASGPGYFGGLNTLNMNAVGSSSWAYFLTPRVGGDATSDTIIVDEFDNLTHDAYWGLALNPADGTFALSYTLQGSASAASIAAREFAQSIGRTEGNSGFAITKLAGEAVAFNEGASGFSNRLLGDAEFTAAPVPEPGTWALMALGLGAVGWRARRAAAERSSANATGA